MSGDAWFVSTLFTWVVLPLLIFLARIVDVSLQTLRVVFIGRGMKRLAPVVGFFEVIIWLLAIGQIMRHLTNPVCYLAYGGGFAAGTWVGMWIESRLSLGMVILRVITRRPADDLLAHLNAQDLGVTSVEAQGATGPVKVIFAVIRRQDLSRVVEIVHRFNPKAFYSVEDVRFASEGIFPLKRCGEAHPLAAERKGK